MYVLSIEKTAYELRISDWSAAVCSSDPHGVEIFDEIKAGDIRSGGFDLNGSWAPFYTVHKVFAGLLDIHRAWGNRKALDVATGFAGSFEGLQTALTPQHVTIGRASRRERGCQKVVICVVASS